jgi:hypothetical protein
MTVNGHRPGALTLTLPPLGVPRLPVPQPADNPAGSSSPAPAPAAGDSDTRTSRTRPRLLRGRGRWHLPDGDTVIAWAMAITVTIVAVDAAIVSYSHIYDLATGQTGNGTETGIQAVLLPISIDGVIAEASLVLLYAARHVITPPPKLARFMLSLGIGATVAANVAHGLPSSMLSPVVHVVIGALLSAWPAGAFIGSVEMAMGLVRAARSVATGNGSGGDASDTSDTKPPPKRPRARRAGSDKNTDPVTACIKRHPDWDNDRIAASLGVSRRTVERRRNAVAKTPAAAGSATP